MSYIYSTSQCANKCKRDFLFRGVNNIIRDTLLLDEESLYSTTDQLTAEKIAIDVSTFIPRTSTITDATACIGGSTHAFANIFDRVNAIEIDPLRFNYLTHNLSMLQCNSNITCINGDAVIECKRILGGQDVIFIDPPWGGPEYKNKGTVSLFLSGIPLADVCKDLASYTRYIVLKVPVNFDEANFLLKTGGVLTLVHKNTNLRKMRLLIFQSTYKESHN